MSSSVGDDSIFGSAEGCVNDAMLERADAMCESFMTMFADKTRPMRFVRRVDALTKALVMQSAGIPIRARPKELSERAARVIEVMEHPFLMNGEMAAAAVYLLDNTGGNSEYWRLVSEVRLRCCSEFAQVFFSMKAILDKAVVGGLCSQEFAQMQLVRLGLHIFEELFGIDHSYTLESIFADNETQFLLGRFSLGLL